MAGAMAVRLRIRERCTSCGQIAAWREGDRIKGWHKCPGQPPGPPIPPINFHTSEVVFIPDAVHTSTNHGG
jgi:hypothetical protein